jgi:hypothetical protein
MRSNTRKKRKSTRKRERLNKMLGRGRGEKKIE